MELRNNWLRIVCAGSLACGIVLAPLSASAQSKPKKHKVSHTSKTHTHHARHKRKAQAVIVPSKISVPVVAVKVAPPIPVVPSGPVAGTPYDEATWRGFHSDWNGEYHFNGGKYYYDPEFKYVAQIPNDFNSVAARFGGVATLDNDPTLIFTGESGQPYPILEYNADRSNSDKKLKLKCAYFGRAYFWRDGARYDRKIIVDATGARCFQFVKHP